MRFDDSLATVLAADTATDFGAQSAWRQLVDLAGRRRVPDLAAAVARLRELRDAVPAPVRAASARSLASGEPPLALVTFFVEDELAVSAPALRAAKLTVAEWEELLPRLAPATRSVLRQRRDLPEAIKRALASFGTTDFVLGHDKPEPVTDPLGEAPRPTTASPVAAFFKADAPFPKPASGAVPGEVAPPVQATTPFLAVGRVARALPVVAEALRQVADPPQFGIADLVARIDAFRRDHPKVIAAPRPVPAPEQWQFETDALGVIRWVEGVARGPLIGATLALGGRQGLVQVDASIGGALRARDSFRDVRLEVGGDTSASGSWRLAGVPRFDRATGRYTGLAGIARRPRREESAGPATSASDSLRQLVHELRTPINAIAGFSELICAELLGPVPPIYRDRARIIQAQVAGLIGAIDDLDTAARIDGEALDLRPSTFDLAPVLARVVADLQPLAAERRATLVADLDGVAVIRADDRAAGRLIDRLLTTVIAVAEPGERLRAQIATKTRTVRLHVTRPRALRVGADDTLLAIDAESQGEGEPLLGTGFTLRLVRNLAMALDGSLTTTPDRLTLRLPAAVNVEMERITAR